MNIESNQVNHINSSAFSVNRWTVVILKKGDKFGLNNCLTHENDIPTVEIYDNHQSAEIFGQYGQFVSRYHAPTFMTKPWSGVNLDGGIPEWTINASDHNLIAEQLEIMLASDANETSESSKSSDMGRDIRSIGYLDNHDGSVRLTPVFKNNIHPLFITLSKEKFDAIRGNEQKMIERTVIHVKAMAVASSKVLSTQLPNDFYHWSPETFHDFLNANAVDGLDADDALKEISDTATLLADLLEML